MSAPALVCSACGSPAVERSAVVQECSCGCRKMVYRPPMNMTERARRAEALLAATVDAAWAMTALDASHPDDASKVPAARLALIKACERAESHAADLATLEGRDG